MLAVRLAARASSGRVVVSAVGAGRRSRSVGEASQTRAKDVRAASVSRLDSTGELARIKVVCMKDNRPYLGR